MKYTDGIIEIRPTGETVRRGTVCINFTVYLNGTGPIGECVFRNGKNAYAETVGNVGFSIDEKYRGKRYSLRVLNLLKRYARSLGFNTVYICTAPGNKASGRICELSGAVYEGTFPYPENSEEYAYGKTGFCRYVLQVIAEDRNEQQIGGDA